MKIFTHFDKTIFMIYLTHDFISLLRKEDMSFRVVPVILKPPLSLKDRVVAYTSLDDIQLYALIVHWEYGEKVLITDTVPEDGWESLYMDVCAQRQGEQPNEPGTLFYEVVQYAIDKIGEERRSDSDTPLSDEAEFNDEDFKAIRKILEEHGITPITVCDIGSWDVEYEMLIRIFPEFKF